MVGMTNWSVNLLNCNITVKLAWLDAKNNSSYYYRAKTTTIYWSKTNTSSANKMPCVQSSPKSSRGGKKKNKKQKQVGDMEYSVKLKLIQMKKACKDVLSEAASESEHMHLLNTPEVHQRRVLNPGFSVCFSGSIKDCSLVTKSTSTKQ